MDIDDLRPGDPQEIPVAQLSLQFVERLRYRIAAVRGKYQDFLAFGICRQYLGTAQHLFVAAFISPRDIPVVDLVQFTDNSPDLIRQGVAAYVEFYLLISVVDFSSDLHTYEYIIYL